MLETEYTFFNAHKWRHKGYTGNGLEIYEHKETGVISIYNPITGDIVED